MKKNDDNDRVKLKVGELTERGDFGRGIGRISAKHMKSLGISDGDIIEIEGKRKTGAIAVRAYPVDVGLDIIRIDGLVRRNCGAGIGEPVKIKKSEVKEAKSVVIAPARKGIIIHMGGNLMKQNLLMRPVITGDIIIPNPIVQDRRSQTTLFEQFFGIEFGDFLFTPFGEEKFVVVSTEPNGIVRITRTTDVELLPQATKPLEEERIPEVTYEDLGGLHEEIKKVREMIELPLKHPELFERLGVEPPRGILLHGPPGTGKTLLAKAVANESGAKFFVLNGPECMSKFYGESEENLRKLFEQAEKSAPSIIFIDEIDAIAPKREEVRGEVEKRVVSQLLTLLDGLKARGKIIVIGATNIPNALDPALRRPGRFDREIEIGVPNKDGRKEILQIHTRGMPIAKDVNLDKISEITYGYVGADIAALCKEAAMYALRRVLPDMGAIKEDRPIPPEVLKKLIVSKQDFEHALKMVEPSAMREVLIEVPKIKWNDIGGLENVKKLLKESIEWPLEYPDSFKRLGIKPPTGVLLYGPPGCGKCITGDTEVLQADGSIITIKEMYENAEKEGIIHTNGFETIIENVIGEIISLNPKNLKLEKKPIKYFYRQAYNGEIIAITTKTGRKIKVTPEHPLFTINNGVVKKCSKDIIKGDYIAIPRKIEIEGKNVIHNELTGFNTIKNSDGTLIIQYISKYHPYNKKINTLNFISSELGEWIGYFLAEGSRVTSGINFHNSDTTLINRVAELSRKLFNIEPLIRKDTSEGVFKLECNSKTLMEYLKQTLGYVHKNARVNNVPDALLKSSNNAIASFLKAFFDSEACVRKDVPEIEIISASKSIANSIAYMLLRFGIVSRIRPKKVKDYDHIYWRLFIIGKNNLLLFKNNIGFSVKEKSKRLDRLLQHGKESTTYDITPNIEKILTKARLESGLSKQKFYQTKHGKKYELEGKHISRKQLQKIVSNMVDDEAEELKILSKSDVMWDEVTDISKEYYNGYIYDLTIEDNHNFIAGLGGIIVHNTLLAKAVANESGSNFISVKGPELLSMWVGESEKHVRNIFRRAKQVAPSIIFFDEIDTLVPRRGGATDSHVTERVVSQLLAEISGLEDLNDVVVVAATNRPDIVDPALLRPGRFDRQILVPTPDEKTREEILNVHTKNMPLDSDVDIKKLTRDTIGFSGADLEALAREAAMNAMRKNIKAVFVTKKDFMYAMKEVRPSVTEEMNEFYEDLMKKKKSRAIEESNYTG